jgi:2-keto-4-pentenoate hydratase/2-oxohepta-3-ene-1,7-dioic acid hydratase in catechol pathway
VKLANVAGRAVVVTTDAAPGGIRRGVDVAEASAGRFGPDVHDVYESWTAFRAFATELEGDSPTVEVHEAHLHSPAPRPRQVFAIGLNYRAHAQEQGREVSEVPATFTKFPACLAGPFEAVELPSATVDWEVELVVVIGVRADRASEAAGWDHVAGLTVGQDLSERTVQRAAGNQFSLGKSYRGFGPMGPLLVTPDELGDRDDLALGCSVDGEVVQDGRTGDLVFTVPRLVAELSAVVPLLPGDVIFTGTPSGVGVARTPPRFLQPGQVLESWVEGVGTIRNALVAPSS